MKGSVRLLLLFCAGACFIISATNRRIGSGGTNHSIEQFRSDSREFYTSLTLLLTSLENANSTDTQSIEESKCALINSRLKYKKIEYFLEYFFYTSSRIYNRAPKNEIEEPFLEYLAPAGFQYIESMLFDSLPETHRDEFREQIKLLSLSAGDLPSLLYKFEPTDQQILESARLQLIRIMTLGITGFDAPLLKSGIQESHSSLQAIQSTLQPYFKKNHQISDSVRFHVENSLKYLSEHPGFDTFNRLFFSKKYALPLQKHLGDLIRDLNLETNKFGYLNYDSDHLFTSNSLIINKLNRNPDYLLSKKAKLGEKLFFETKLSGNSRKSCASCHSPNSYFTDALPKSVAFEANKFVKRNAPTLLYAGYQHNQFWDGRAKSIENQIESVIKDPLEMNGDAKTIQKELNDSRAYRKLFKNAFGKKRGETIEENDIYAALAAYIRTLNPFNSPFDQYMMGNDVALTDNQISGFNLFMGKAQCGTCHFAPLFNGLIPPFYMLTEFEVLGTTENDDFANAKKDDDQGRFSLRNTPFYKNAFKTPTVRNSAKTGPYMHNGSFKTLDSVVEFYDLGGGAGLGLDFPNQTLSSAKLNLTDQEKKDIIAFLHALTDDLKEPK